MMLPSESMQYIVAEKIATIVEITGEAPSAEIIEKIKHRTLLNFLDGWYVDYTRAQEKLQDVIFHKDVK